MMMKYKLLIILFITFLFSCKKGNDLGRVINEYPGLEEKCTIIFEDSKEFSLDSITINIIGYLQFLELDSIQIVSFLNEHDNSIYFYNYETLEFIRKISYSKENSKNKMTKMQGYLYVDDNEIYNYSYGWHMMYCTNSNSEILSQKLMYDHALENKELFPAPFLHTPSPLKLFNEKIISLGLLAGEYDSEKEKIRMVASILDLNTNKISYKINYPEQYLIYNWGGGLTYRMPYYDLNEERMVVSFSAHHNLIVYNLLTEEKTEYYAGSKYVKEIPSYPAAKTDQPFSGDVFEWYMENSSYEGVFYDKYRNVYYRIVRLPVDKYDSDKRYNDKPVSVIILDAEFNYIGETKLSTEVNYNPFNTFVSKEGLNIQIWTNDEDELMFYQYKLEYYEK